MKDEEWTEEEARSGIGIHDYEMPYCDHCKNPNLVVEMETISWEHKETHELMMVEWEHTYFCNKCGHMVQCFHGTQLMPKRKIDEEGNVQYG